MRDRKTDADRLTRVRELIVQGFGLQADSENFRHSADEAPYVFAYKYGLYSLYRKLAASTDATRLDEECWATYKKTDARIAQVNSDIRLSMGSKPDPRRIKLLLSMRRKILEILGPEPDLRELAQGASWGPGATSTLKAAHSTVDKKLIEPQLSVTMRCRKYAVAYLSNSLLWMRARIPDVEGLASPLASEFLGTEHGRFSSVPKTATVRRPIDVQPTLNLFFQKGVGSMIRRRLKRFGINLDDQSRNQRLAELAYSRGLSTIDLEAASDSVSYELVKQVLPPKWFDLLNDLRTHLIIRGDESHRLEKFSSMGNGFTFELESLLFYSLCHHVVREENIDRETPIAVYGDDIIVARRHYDSVVLALQDSGFLVNNEKSFKEGNFFESCGGHYYRGFDVTPVYQKEICTSPEDWVRFANRLWRWAYRLGSGLCLDSALRPAFEYCCERAQTCLAEASVRHGRRRLKAPPTLPRQPWWMEGDRGLISCESFHFDVNGVARLPLFLTLPGQRQGCHEALYCESLRGDKPISEHPSYGCVSPRGLVKSVISQTRVYGNNIEAPHWV